MSSAVKGMLDYLVERLGHDIADDRILLIPGRDDQIGYVDTEASQVFLITVQEAQLVPASNTDQEPSS